MYSHSDSHRNPNILHALFFDSGVCEKKFLLKSAPRVFAPTLPPTVNVEEMAVALVSRKKVIFFSQAPCHSHIRTINIDETGEGLERVMASNAEGNLFSQTPVSKNM